MKPNLLSYLAIVFGAFLIGFTGILFKLADVSPATGALWRFIFALPISFVWMMWEEKGKIPPFSSLPLVILCGFAFAGDILSFHAAMEFTTVAKATIIGGLAPILVVLMALFIGERPSKTLLMALTFAIVGGALIIGAKGNLTFQSSELRGDILALVSCVFFASYIVLMRVARGKNKSGMFNFFSTLFAAVGALIYALVTNQPLTPHSAQSWAILALLGLVCHGIGQGLTAYAMGRIPAGIASVVMVFNVPIATVGAAVILQQMPMTLQIVGGVLVIVALVLMRPKENSQ